MPTANSAEVLTAQQAFLDKLDNDLWTAANKLRNQLNVADYKHIVLGLTSLKYISDSFEEQRRLEKKIITTKIRC